MFYALAMSADKAEKIQNVIDSGAFSPERLAMTGEMILVGLGMVFAVLATLWGVLTIFKLVFAKPEKKKAEPKPAPAVEEAPTYEPETVAEATDDGELVAVITAAVAAYMASEEPDAAPNGFRVVSFRRANGGRAWNASSK